MYIQGESGDSVALIPVWQNIFKIQFYLGLNNSKLSELLEVTPDELRKFKTKQKEPPLANIFKFCQNLNIDFSSFMTGMFDFKTLNKHYSGDFQYIPEKYLESAQTKKRVIVNMLKHIEDNYGYDQKLMALRSLQIFEAGLENLDETVNLRLSVDLINWINYYIQAPNALHELGQELLFNRLNSHLILELKGTKNVRTLFEKVFDEFLEKYMEKNLKWTIHQMSNDELVVRGRVNQEVSNHLEKKYILSQTGMKVRLGLLSSFPMVFGLAAPSGRITKPLEHEADYCELKLDLHSLGSFLN